MAKQLEFVLSIDESTARRLRDGARQLGASEAELASIDRLEAFLGTSVDVDRLGPLALALGIDWGGMWKGGQFG